MDRHYEVIEFMEKHGLVPMTRTFPAETIPLKELRVPHPRTDECYYLRVQDGVVTDMYRKIDLVWGHTK